MDTSSDHRSQTLDFLLGDGTKLPAPTDRDLAQMLFVIINNLMKQGVIADIIGNRPMTLGENDSLRCALDADPDYGNGRQPAMRARKIFSTYHVDGLDSPVPKAHDHVYLACTRHEAFWFIVTTIPGRAKDTVSRMTVDSLVTFFSYRANWGTHVGRQFLGKLIGVIQEEITIRQERLHKMESCVTTLLNMSERASSAFITPRTSGDGIEG